MKALVIGVFCVMTASSAYAQEGRYVMGVGGVTFGTETSAVFGAEGGVRMRPNLVVFGEVGRMLNITPQDVQDDLDDAAELLELETGFPWSFDSKIPATYFGAGAKYLIPSNGAMNFYVAGSIGVARLTAEIEEEDLGDIVDDLIDEGFLDEDDVRATKIYFALGGGVEGNIGTRGMFDVGYRFVKISDANVSRLTAGVGVRF